MPLLKRLLSSSLTLLVMGLLIFMLVDWLPGDTCSATLGQDAQVATLLQCQQQLGLDQPAHHRFLQWLQKLLSGDSGLSLSRNREAWDVLAPRLQNTLLLAAIAGTTGFFLAIIPGLLSGWFQRPWVENCVSCLSLLFMSLPEFVLALPLIWLFSYQLGWFPAVSLIYDGQSLWQKINMAFLPAMTLALIMNAHVMSTVRASARVIREAPFIQMARLKGVQEPRVLFRHGIKSILAPCMGTISLYMAWLTGGVVVTERVFNYPGLGSLMFSAIQDRDYPMVQLSAMSITLLCILCSLLGDLLTFWLNPRGFQEEP